MRTGSWLAALAGVFLAAHLAFLPPTLEDIDSINFALGVRDFDVGLHQPHPPGYPVFIALGKVSTPVFRALGVSGAEPRALAFWSAISGALLIPLLFALYRAVDGDERRAFWAAALAACSPLVWSTSVRPLSDTTGLALAVAAQALLAMTLVGRGGPRALAAGAFLAAFAAGVRVQTAVLSAPALVAALIAAPAAVASVRHRTVAMAAAVAGAAAWFVPLLIASGGPTHYLTALGSQAGEDFEGVVMLWTMRTPRVALEAVLNSFVRPWGPAPVGGVVLVVAIGGLLRALGARTWRSLAILALLFGPYMIFHLLFHETATMRYAMPLVIPIAYFFIRGATFENRPPVVPLAAAALFLVISVPPMTAFARHGSPAFAAFRDASAAGVPVGAHAGMRRVWEWLGERGGSRFLAAPHGYEWLMLVEAWGRTPDAPIEFIANPSRTDLALFDRYAIAESRPYRWSFPEEPFVAGARPGAVDRVRFNPPGWMLDRGWALTAEVAGITERDGHGPHRKPSVAWIRGRAEATTVLVGGRHLGEASDPDAQVEMRLNGVPLAQWRVRAGFFVRQFELPAGTFAGAGYLPLEFTATSTSTPPVRVALEQFDLQPAGVPMVGLMEGWQEPEYNPLTGRAWRWSSERAALWVRPVGRDVTLTLRGESPLRYFDAPPRLIATANQFLGALSPTDDFEWNIRIPAADLAATNGRVVIESDKWFVPGERDGSADKRHLALRVYSYEVR